MIEIIIFLENSSFCFGQKNHCFLLLDELGKQKINEKWKMNKIIKFSLYLLLCFHHGFQVFNNTLSEILHTIILNKNIQ